jgi:hypothetical protein
MKAFEQKLGNKLLHAAIRLLTHGLDAVQNAKQ